MKHVLTRILQRCECNGTLSVHNQEGSRTLKLTLLSLLSGTSGSRWCWGSKRKIHGPQDFGTSLYHIILEKKRSHIVLNCWDLQVFLSEFSGRGRYLGRKYQFMSSLKKTLYHGTHSDTERAFSSPHSNRQLVSEYLRQVYEQKNIL